MTEEQLQRFEAAAQKIEDTYNRFQYQAEKVYNVTCFGENAEETPQWLKDALLKIVHG